MYVETTPHPALSRHVDRLWASGSATAPKRVLPDGCIDVIVDLATGTARVVGTMTRAIVVPALPDRRAVAVRFRPGGATPFLRTGAAGLTDRALDARDVGVGWLAPETFAGTRDLAVATARLEAALLARLASVDAPEPTVAHAVARLFAPAPPSIAELARDLGWTRQYLGRLFHAEVGISPKQLARVARVQRAVDALQHGGDLADVALATGYFDQAHMALDLRDLADVTPRQVRAAAGSIVPIRSLFAAS